MAIENLEIMDPYNQPIDIDPETLQILEERIYPVSVER